MINQLQDHIQSLQADAEQGTTSAIKTYIEIYQMEKLVAEAKKAVSALAIEERDRYDRKEVIVQDGYKVSIVETTRYSYNDVEIDRYKALIKSREDLAKQAFAIEQKGGILTDETGEVIPAAIPSYSTSIKLEQHKP